LQKRDNSFRQRTPTVNQRQRIDIVEDFFHLEVEFVGLGEMGIKSRIKQADHPITTK
jgi:hypothetical protein